MNLLVTNTHAPQAYAVVRALRPHASRIVATIEGGGAWAAAAAHAAHSRLVDRRCAVPSPAADWASGKVTPENTPREASYVDALLRICREEKIDAIYPSWDPNVYVLAKNRERFAAEGVVIPVPAYEVVLTALDKHRTVALAQEAGFPCPRTRLYDGPDGLAAAADELGFPLVVKPRFTSGGRGMAIVRDRRELAVRAPAIAEAHGPPLLQEYIPGGDRGSVQLVLGRDGQVLFAFHKARRRKLRLTARYGTVSESAAPDGPVGRTAELVGRLGWWGALGIETIHDPRDGVAKLMEINPRFPRQLWNRTRLGINEPWMCLRLAQGEKVEAIGGYPLGVLFVSPVEDLLLFAFQILDRAAYRVRCLAGRPLDPAAAAPPVVDLLRSFLGTYRSPQRKLLDPYSRFFLQDPATSLLWWLQFSTWVFGGWRHLGR